MITRVNNKYPLCRKLNYSAAQFVCLGSFLHEFLGTISDKFFKLALPTSLNKITQLLFSICKMSLLEIVFFSQKCIVKFNFFSIMGTQGEKHFRQVFFDGFITVKLLLCFFF